jgi:hypothetical protein
MLGWLRTAGLTASVGGQEGVSDGYLIGRSPQTPRGSRKQQDLGKPVKMWTTMAAKVSLAVLSSLLPSGRHGLRQTTVDAIRRPKLRTSFWSVTGRAGEKTSELIPSWHRTRPIWA